MVTWWVNRFRHHPGIMLFSLCFLGMGLTLIVQGSLERHRYTIASDVMVSDLCHLPALEICTGVALVAASFLGLYSTGPGRISTVVLLLAVLAGVAGVQLGTGIFAMLTSVSRADALEVELTLRTLYNKSEHGNTDGTRQVDDMQTTFQCCGPDGSSYYNGRPLPPSCCPVSVGSNCILQDAFSLNCIDAVLKIFEQYGYVHESGLLNLVFAIIQFLGIVFLFFVIKRMRQHQDGEYSPLLGAARAAQVPGQCGVVNGDVVY